MQLETQNVYFETQINTATPQRLRLMLIDGALRQTRLTLDQWREGAPAEQALESLIRAREIVGELIAGIHADESPLAGQVSSLYVYLFSALTEAQQTRDTVQLAAVIRVLEEDRETWRQLCEQLGDRPAPAAAPSLLSAGEELAPALVASPRAFSIDA